MNSLLSSCFLTFICLAADHSFAAGVVGNGGQVVHCGEPLGAEVSYQPEAGFYSLDYIQSRDIYEFASVESLEESFDRIESLLDLLPSMQSSFREFRNLIGNSKPNEGHRIWLYSDQRLAEINDTQTLRLLPPNCSHREAGDGYGAFQIVVRRPVGNLVYYEVYRPYMDKIQENPLQASLLYVHEWLWDYAADAYQSRHANAFLHLKNVSAEEVASLMVSLKLINPQASLPEAPKRQEITKARGLIYRDLNTALYKLQYVVPANLASDEPGQVYLASCPNAMIPNEVYPNCPDMKIEKNICLRRFIHNIQTKVAPSYRNRSQFLSDLLEVMTNGSSIQNNDSLFKNLSNAGFTPNHTVVKTTHTAKGTCQKWGGKWVEVEYGPYTSKKIPDQPDWKEGYPVVLQSVQMEKTGSTYGDAVSAIRAACDEMFPLTKVETSNRRTMSGQEHYFVYYRTYGDMYPPVVNAASENVENPVSCR